MKKSVNDGALLDGYAIMGALLRRNSSPYDQRIPGLFQFDHNGFRFISDDRNRNSMVDVSMDWKEVSEINYNWDRSTIAILDDKGLGFRFWISYGVGSAVNTDSGLRILVAYFRHFKKCGARQPTVGQINELVSQMPPASKGVGCLVFMPFIVGGFTMTAWSIFKLIA